MLDKIFALRTRSKSKPERMVKRVESFQKSLYLDVSYIRVVNEAFIMKKNDDYIVISMMLEDYSPKQSPANSLIYSARIIEIGESDGLLCVNTSSDLNGYCVKYIIKGFVGNIIDYSDDIYECIALLRRRGDIPNEKSVLIIDKVLRMARNVKRFSMRKLLSDDEDSIN
jgi:hypothetical protein